MADNVTVDNYTVSTDDAGAAGQVQRVKLAYSADGVATHVTADADGLLVNLGANNDVTVSGVSTAANQSTLIGHVDGIESSLSTLVSQTDGIEGSLTTLAGAVAGTEMQVDIVSSAAVPVTDNSGSLTVDAPVGTPVFVRLSDGSSAVATLPVSLASVPSHAVTNAGTFAVQADAVTPGTGATNLGKAEDAVHGSGDTGVMALAVRSDTASAKAGTDGDYAPLLVDANGRLHVVLSAATNQPTNVAQMNGVAVTMGNGASGTGVQRVSLASDSTGNIATIGTSVTPGTSAAHLGKAEDAAHNSGDTGVMSLAVRTDTATARAGTDGDYIPLITDSSGRLWVNVGSMAGTVRGKAYTQATTGALTTDLNSLANNTNSSASAAIDNTSNLDNFMTLELVVAAQGSSRSAGATVEVYMVIALDGTNYGDVHETTAEIVASFPLDAATTARRCHRRDIPIPPANFKLFVRNRTGQSFAASGSALNYRTHSSAIV